VGVTSEPSAAAFPAKTQIARRDITLRFAPAASDTPLTALARTPSQSQIAERAVRAGLAVIDAVGHLAAPEPLNVRLGVASGVVVVGVPACCGCFGLTFAAPIGASLRADSEFVADEHYSWRFAGPPQVVERRPANPLSAAEFVDGV
jgi:hypothetical protein